VPTLLTVDLRDDPRVREFARQRLEESLHYTGVEIWEDDRFVGEVQLTPDQSGTL
jgi:hypothetical protein